MSLTLAHFEREEHQLNHLRMRVGRQGGLHLWIHRLVSPDGQTLQPENHESTRPQFHRLSLQKGRRDFRALRRLGRRLAEGY